MLTSLAIKKGAVQPTHKKHKKLQNTKAKIVAAYVCIKFDKKNEKTASQMKAVYQRSILYFLKSYLPFLSFIHEKTNCIALFWTKRPHSLGSCHCYVSGPPVYHIKVREFR